MPAAATALTPLEQQIAESFDQCQQSFATHSKHVGVLTKLAASCSDPDEFWRAFLRCVHPALTVFKRELAVERVIQFIVRFSTTYVSADADDHAFALALVRSVVGHSRAKDRAVRFRVCQLVAGVLGALGEQDVEVPDDLVDLVIERMVERAADRVAAVRVQAVAALTFLQDPTDQDDLVTATYVQLLQRDQSKDVRKAVLSNIGLAPLTLPHVLARVRDVHQDVRKHAFHVLAHKVHMPALTLQQRMQLLQHGLRDRVADVSTSCADMLTDSWLVQKQGDVLALVQALAIAEYPEAGEAAVRVLVDAVLAARSHAASTAASLAPPPGAADGTLPSLEQALVWRVYCEQVSKAAQQAAAAGPSFLAGSQHARQVDACDGLVVTASQLAHLVSQARASTDAEAREPVLRNLLRIGRFVDLDEAGRAKLTTALTQLLRDLTSVREEETVAAAVDLLATVLGNAKALTRAVTGLISDVQAPPERPDSPQDVAAAELAERWTSLQLRHQTALDDERYEDASILAEEMSGLQAKVEAADRAADTARVAAMSEPAWLRCTALAGYLLKTTKMSLRNAEISDLMKSTIQPAIRHANPVVRNQGIASFGLYCLLSLDNARSSLMLFVQVLRNDQDVLQGTAMKALFDILLVFGRKALAQTAAADGAAADSDGDDDAADQAGTHADGDEAGVQGASNADEQLEVLLHVLLPYLDHSDSSLRRIAAEGFAKLLFFRVVSDVRLVSRLLILFHHPVTEDEPEIRQCLAVFFPSYAFMVSANQRMLARALLPTLRVLLDAPDASPLRRIAPHQLARYTLHLLDADKLLSTSDALDAPCTDELALQIANVLLAEPNSADAAHLARVLSDIPVSEEQSSAMRTLLANIQQDCQDRATLRWLQRSVKRLASADDAPADEEESALLSDKDDGDDGVSEAES